MLMARHIFSNWTQSVADTNPAEEPVTLCMLTVRLGAAIGAEPLFIYTFIYIYMYFFIYLLSLPGHWTMTSLAGLIFATSTV